jgi:hypothetical protein
MSGKLSPVAPAGSSAAAIGSFGEGGRAGSGPVAHPATRSTAAQDATRLTAQAPHPTCRHGSEGGATMALSMIGQHCL